MSPLVGAAAVPAAPLVLRLASPAQPEQEAVGRIRELATEALERLPQAEAFVLVGCGPRGIYDRAHASLSSLNVPDGEVDLPVHERFVEDLSRLVQYPVLRGDDLDLGLAVLALQLHGCRGAVPVVPMNVPPRTDFDVLVSVGAALGEAATDTDVPTAVVVAGDLSAGLAEDSAGYAIDGAARWDERVVEAARSGGLDALRELGPEEAERVQAVGWAPLVVLHGVCASGGLTLEQLGYLPTRGVGHLVARCVGAGRRRSDRYDTRPDGDDGD